MAFYRIALSTRHFAASTATHYYILRSFFTQG